MMKKNEVIEILNNGGHIGMNDIYRCASVYDRNGQRLDSCRYDTAERIGNTEGYKTERGEAWSFTTYVKRDPRHDDGNPYGLAACIESLEFDRDFFKRDAAEIAAHLLHSRDVNGCLFNRTMWDAFAVLFPDFPVCYEVMREIYAALPGDVDHAARGIREYAQTIESERAQEQQQDEAQEQQQDEAQEPELIPVDSLREGLELGDYGEYVNDYRGSSAYICDMVAEIADSNTSIYYSDIMHFISENPEALADVIEEGLYDPSHGYDVHQHGQAAEYMTIERDIWDHLEDALYLAALDFIRYDMERETIPAELAELLRDWAADPGNRMSDIPDRIREYFHDAQEDDEQ